MRLTALFHEPTWRIFSGNEMRREGLDKSCCLSSAARRGSAVSSDPLWVTCSNGCQPAVSANKSLFYVVTTQVRCPTGLILGWSGLSPHLQTASHIHGAAPLRTGRVIFPFKEVCLKMTPCLLRRTPEVADITRRFIRARLTAMQMEVKGPTKRHYTSYYTASHLGGQ